MPLHHLVFASVVIGAVACAGCHVSTTYRPAATTQGVTSVVDTWRHDEMRLAAYGYEEASEERVPNGDVTVMRWRVIEDDRPLVVEEAIVLVKTDDGRWRLAKLYRHPKESRQPIEWRIWSRTDVPFVSHRDFKAEPTPAQVERFLKDTEWLPLPDGFRETAGGGA
jgi:hypothetical protein